MYDQTYIIVTRACVASPQRSSMLAEVVFPHIIIITTINY